MTKMRCLHTKRLKDERAALYYSSIFFCYKQICYAQPSFARVQAFAYDFSFYNLHKAHYNKCRPYFCSQDQISPSPGLILYTALRWDYSLTEANVSEIMSRACVSRNQRSVDSRPRDDRQAVASPSHVSSPRRRVFHVKNYAIGRLEEDPMIGGVPASRVYASIIVYVSLTNLACVHCKRIIRQAASLRYASMVSHLHKLT